MSLPDVAIGCPFGGKDGQGLVFIYNGQTTGLKDTPSQVLAGQWTTGVLPTGFGHSIQGNKDLDVNGYPGTHQPIMNDCAVS